MFCTDFQKKTERFSTNHLQENHDTSFCFLNLKAHSHSLPPTQQKKSMFPIGIKIKRGYPDYPEQPPFKGKNYLKLLQASQSFFDTAHRFHDVFVGSCVTHTDAFRSTK
jgi:hypothetical protein